MDEPEQEQKAALFVKHLESYSRIVSAIIC